MSVRQPFFMRFVEQQDHVAVEPEVKAGAESGRTYKYPSDSDERLVTLKYPSDDDEYRGEI